MSKENAIKKLEEMRRTCGLFMFVRLDQIVDLIDELKECDQLEERVSELEEQISAMKEANCRYFIP